MKIQVFSELDIRKFQTEEKHIVISVQDPSYDYVKLPKSKSRLGWIGLKCHDVDDIYIHDFNNWCKDRKIVPFTPYHAKSVLKFVNDWKDKVDLICVNCVAGISRSAGIAGALGKILNGDDMYYFKHYCPNRLAYRTILTEHYGKAFNNFTEKKINDDTNINFL